MWCEQKRAPLPGSDVRLLFRGDKHPGDGAQASCGTRGGGGRQGAKDDVKALLSTCHYIASLLDNA